MAKPLWTATEITIALGVTPAQDFDISGLSIDTRSLKPGDLFIALKDARDGHDFAPSAFAAGAAGAFVSRLVEGGPNLLVEDVLHGLEALGLAARDRAPDCYRVAVTGSVGKTSLKEMLARMFRALGPTHCNVKSFNNHWGVPLTLARMPRDTEKAVFEIGMNTPGEIGPRSQMVQPHTALVSKIAPAHLEGLGSIQGVAEEKAAIFAGLQPHGFAILPHEDSFFEFLKAEALRQQPTATILSFGLSPDADAQILNIKTGVSHSQVSIRVHDQVVDIKLTAVGDHWAVNAAAALLAACPQSTSDLPRLVAALEGYTPPPGRGTAEQVALPDGGQCTLVDEAYNANPESMRAALIGFAARPCQGQRLVALGEMLEIGAASSAEHAALAEPVLASGATTAFLSGAAMEVLHEALSPRIESHFESHAEALEAKVKKVLKDGDLILLKGSNASGMNRLAEKLRRWGADNLQPQESRSEHGTESVLGGLDVV